MEKEELLEKFNTKAQREMELRKEIAVAAQSSKELESKLEGVKDLKSRVDKVAVN